MTMTIPAIDIAEVIYIELQLKFCKLLLFEQSTAEISLRDSYFTVQEIIHFSNSVSTTTASTIVSSNTTTAAGTTTTGGGSTTTAASTTVSSNTTTAVTTVGTTVVRKIALAEF